MARATTNGPDSLVTRFWAKVDRRGEDECWPWRGHVAKGNAGRLSRGGRGGGMISASRLAWELHNGPVPSGLQVIHECPSAWCVNPRHLFAGTAADRGAALVRKGNSRFGERHFNAKLDAATVKRIRAALVRARRPSVTEVARRFGLAKEHVSAICVGASTVGRIWRAAADESRAYVSPPQRRRA